MPGFFILFAGTKFYKLFLPKVLHSFSHKKEKECFYDLSEMQSHFKGK